MKPMRVMILPIAEEDVAELADWIETHDGVERAENVVDAIVQGMESLRSFARRGSVIPEAGTLPGPELRQILTHGCRIIYTIESDTVTVFALIHERRDLEATLSARNAAIARDILRQQGSSSR
jgi:plasmid stabilization system protein ParE